MMRCSIWSMFTGPAEGASPGSDAAQQTNHSVRLTKRQEIREAPASSARGVASLLMGTAQT